MADKIATQNPVLQSFYLALLEILGQDQADKLFRKQGIDPQKLSTAALSGSITDVMDRIGAELEKKNGKMSAQGLFIRTGRASLIFFRRFFPEIAELGSLQNRLKPVDKRFTHSLESVATLWSRETDLLAHVEAVDRGEFKWSMQENKVMQGQTPYFLFGLLEEFCTWLDARKSYRIIYSDPAEGERHAIVIEVRPQE